MRRLFVTLAFALFSLFSFIQSASATAPSTALDDSIEKYQLRYGLRNVFDKRVDDHGNGDEALYGVRNLRVVLNGVVYRGGANNAYNRNGRRNNSNPLPNEGLKNLCEEGFDRAVYLYSTRYETAPKNTSCHLADGKESGLQYSQISPLLSKSGAKQILDIVYRKLTSPADGHPIYLHCWNGWHASGYISSLILRQFCGVSADKAVEYWNRNTDGVNKGAHYDSIRAMIRAFQPYPEYQIDETLKNKICLPF